MRINAMTGILAGLSAAVLVTSLVLTSAAQARGGDWADRQAKKARWLQSQTNQPSKPTQNGD